MSLRDFHIFFITVSSLTMLGFGALCLYHRAADLTGTFTWLGASCLVAGVGLVVYGKKFLDKMKREGIR